MVCSLLEHEKASGEMASWMILSYFELITLCNLANRR